MPHLMVFGPGYTAHPIMVRAKRAGWQVSASYRKEEVATTLSDQGFIPFNINKCTVEMDVPISHLLISIAPQADGDLVLNQWKSWLAQQKPNSIHYLSSTNVYGDHKGGWVDETTPPNPSLARGIRRLAAEQEWDTLGQQIGANVFHYRLAGIYGSGRNAFNSLKVGKARRIIKKGQIFGRIHVEDIATTVWAAMNSQHTGGIFNLSDDMPAPPQDVISKAAEMLGISPPEEEPFETADMTEMARSFYLEAKKVRNNKIKKELAIELQYPTYLEGLSALLEEMNAAS